MPPITLTLLAHHLFSPEDDSLGFDYSKLSNVPNIPLITLTAAGSSSFSSPEDD